MSALLNRQPYRNVYLVDVNQLACGCRPNPFASNVHARICYRNSFEVLKFVAGLYQQWRVVLCDV